jgi:hypothetical protein
LFNISFTTIQQKYNLQSKKQKLFLSLVFPYETPTLKAESSLVNFSKDSFFCLCK